MKDGRKITILMLRTLSKHFKIVGKILHSRPQASSVSHVKTLFVFELEDSLEMKFHTIVLIWYFLEQER